MNQTRLEQQICGHDTATTMLSRAVTTGMFPQSLLITGIPQLGKRTLAYTIANVLVCTSEMKPCGKCIPCRKLLSGNHPDITILDDAEKSLKIEQIRELQHTLSFSPHESLYKIAILADFERATDGAANALLKTLEEPLSYIILILTARSSTLLLPTIVSRCQVISLKQVTDQVIATMLQKKWNVSVDESMLLGRLAAGRPGWAVQVLTNPDLRAERQTYLSDLIELTCNNYHFRLDYANKCIKKDFPTVTILNLWLSWWRDVLLIRSGVDNNVINIDYLNDLRRFANALPTKEILTIVTRTYTTLQNLKYNVNARLNIEVLVLNLPLLKS